MAPPEPNSSTLDQAQVDAGSAKLQDDCEAWKVIEDEREAIARRRDVVFPKGDGNWRPDEVEGDLIGLALSGGGIRSAMFNLGLLQALHRNGLLRYLDYLSTVSGGSYIGAQFSSQMLTLPMPKAQGQEPQPAVDAQQPTAAQSTGNEQAHRPVDDSKLRRLREGFPLHEEPHRPQTKRVLQFIRTGSYLDRPWEFVIHYVSGLFLNLLVFISGMVFLCALVAYFWRLFDLPWLRWVLAFGREEGWWYDVVCALTPDLSRAFIPTALCWLVFGGVWLWAHASGSAVARRMKAVVYVCCWLSVLIAVTVLMGNGETSLGIFRYLVPASWLTYDPGTGEQDSIDLEVFPAYLRLLIYGLLSGVNVAIIAKSLLPLLLPVK